MLQCSKAAALADFKNPYVPGVALAIEVGVAAACDTTSQGTTYVNNASAEKYYITQSTCFEHEPCRILHGQDGIK